MINKITVSKLTLALLSLPLATLSHSAGLDRSGQDVSAFLQDGTYAEAVYTYIDADVSGYDNALPNGTSYNNPNKSFQKGNATGDIADYYDFARYGVKTDVNDTISIGLLYDQPFGADAHYKGVSNFTNNVSGSPASADNETQVEVNTYNLTGLVGFKIGDNLQVYGGPALQRLEADLQLKGIAYGGSNNYSAHLSADDALGWVAGVAFRKPEIGLKAALTYRSEIDHENSISESLPAIPYPVLQSRHEANGPNKIDITSPESLNFDFQTGLNRTTLALMNVRFVPWSDFSIVPPLHNAATQLYTGDNEGLPLVDYSDDQWKVELGLAKRLSPAFAISGNVGWDSGAGNPVTSLGPIEGYYSVGLGAKYNFTPKWALSGGAKYLMFGDAKGAITTDDVVANFEDNDGYVVGVKLSYQDK